MRVFLILMILSFGSTSFAEVVTLTPKNTIAFRGQVDGASVAALQQALADKVEERGNLKYTIYLTIDSPGGDVLAGNDFIEFAKTYPNVKTITIFAASMASAIVNQLPGERLILKTGISMFHKIKSSSKGTPEQIENDLKFLKQLEVVLEQANADRMKLSLQQYKEKIRDDLWLHGAESVRQGAADKVVTVVCSKSLLKNTKSISESFFGMFATNSIYSSCPLIRQPLAVGGN